MPSQFSKSLQYLYFMRSGLLLWLFPAVFALLDTGKLSISTTTLSRGIFVPEYMSGYLCVAFFVIATAAVALITARTVVINGIERFPPKCPDCVENLIAGDNACKQENEDLNKPPQWLEKLLARKDAQGEARAVIIGLVPSAFTFLYLVFCGSFEEIPYCRIICGLFLGTLMAAAFWYVLNACYYFAYERPDTPVGNAPLEIGKNAARTILLPRRWFWLRMPGEGVLADGLPHTLEDIRTTLRDGWSAKILTAIVGGLQQKIRLTGYVYPGGRLYEAQLFSLIAAVGFLVLFCVLYPLTAPRPSNVSLVSIGVVLLSLGWFVRVVWSGSFQFPSTANQRLLHRWKVTLTILAAFFCFMIIYLWLFSDPQRFPTMAAVLLSVILLGWALGALAFWLDRHRVPVLTFAILLAVLPRLAHLYDFFGAEEHYVSTVPRNGTTELPTPAEILDAHLTDLAKSNDHRPLIIVTATGGGLHASAWMTQVIRQLYLQTPKTEWPALTSHILVMSTVSGGSVGLSYYLDVISDNPGNPKLDTMVIGAQCSSLEAVGWGLVYYDLTRAVVPLFPYILWRSGGDGDLDATPLLKDRTWALRKAFERNGSDAYCWDSARTAAPLNPTKPLVLDPHPNGIPWYRRLLATSTSPNTRLTIGGLKAGPQFPAFTMNTTTVEAGDRFMSANYRLPPYQVGSIEGPPAESFLDVFKGENQPDLPLASAAQLSATFPYVSSAVRIPQMYTPYSEHFVDGGYYDNDGTSSAIEFLRYALDPPVSGTANADPKDAAAKTDIGGRGPVDILLIEIRNSTDTDAPASGTQARVLTVGEPYPAKWTTYAGLLPQLGFPLEGFWNAGHGSVTARDRNGLDLLLQSHKDNLHLHQIIFDDQPPTDARWYINSAQDPLSWSLTPKERKEVMTSSDPKAWLNKCYQDAIAWFGDFQGKYDAGKLTPVRCKASP